MELFNKIFKNRKKEEEKLRLERQAFLDTNLEKTTKIQQENIELQKKNAKLQDSVMEIAWKNQELNEQLKQLVLDNERTKNILLGRENKIKVKQEELDERQKEIRRSEIEITARKAEVRKNEHNLKEKEKNIAWENERIEKRELEAEKVKIESEKAKDKYTKLYDEIESDKENIKNLKEQADKKNKEAEDKLNNANSINEKAKVIDDEIKAKEAEFEERRESIEKSLNEKIAEYDRRLEDLDAVKGIVDDVKFDKSKDGREAKIVVKEAIRQAKKELTDIKTKFEELEEKYSSGTFKGFATPLSEIDKDFEDLKTQYIQIKEHFSSEENLPISVSNWIENIEESINNADKFIKSWEFSEAYRNIVWGLSTCKNYELLLLILNDFANEESEWEEEEEEEKDFVDWYEILDVDPKADEKEIKKAYRKAAKKYHPDKNEGSEESTEMFKQIKDAFEILNDTEKRKAFDKRRNNKNKG